MKKDLAVSEKEAFELISKTRENIKKIKKEKDRVGEKMEHFYRERIRYPDDSKINAKFEKYRTKFSNLRDENFTAEAALEVFEAEHAAIAEQIRMGDEAARWEIAERASEEALKLAEQVDSHIRDLSVAFKKLTNTCHRLFSCVPQKDTDHFETSPLAKGRMLSALKVASFKFGLDGLATLPRITNKEEIPTVVDRVREGAGWALRFRDSEQIKIKEVMK